jgi:hypothetical protein
LEIRTSNSLLRNLEVIGIVIIAYIVLGLLGWGLKGIGVIFDLLWEGCSTSIGCLFWAVIVLLLIVGMALWSSVSKNLHICCILVIKKNVI